MIRAIILLIARYLAARRRHKAASLDLPRL